jgi:predicted homoserine dehydrogenase-like protein
MNSELDATLGPILKVYADKAGVIYSNCDGDQPGVIMNLYRFVKGMGFTPLLLGNIKGLHDPYRTPATQKAFAEKYHQKPVMVTSFADGTKISMEMAVVANATGFRVGRRGMFGPSCAHVKDACNIFPLDRMLQDGGWVDYVVGAEPAGGIFVLGYHEDPIQQEYLKYYKMGDGPLYAFNVPYHLCHFEAGFSIARVALAQDSVMAPIGAPVVDVLAVAKRDLKAGEILDGIGGFDTYGVADNAAVCYTDRLLPMGLAEACRLKRSVAKDAVLSYDDIELPPGRLCDCLRAEQNRHFASQR